MPRLAFDLGMNTGSETRHYLSRGWRVVAVEANPRQFSKRAPQFVNDTNAIVLNKAIFTSSGATVRFCASGAYGVSSHIKGATNKTDDDLRCTGVAATRVKTVTCSDLVGEYSSRYGQRPYLVKIDIEGYEIACLWSLLSLPMHQLPEMITFESPMHVQRGSQAKFDQLVGAMEAAGYVKWKRQWWSHQRGHGFIGNEVLDVGFRPGHLWANASAVRGNGCGEELLPVARRSHDCDFHAKLVLGQVNGRRRARMARR